MGKVHGLAFKMSGQLTLADDLTQDIFVKVIKALNQFKHKSTFSTWLYSIAMNEIYSALRKQAKEAGRSTKLKSVAIQSQENEKQKVLCDELRAQLDCEIQNLKPEFRAAIILTAFQGLSSGEAAQVEGCSPQTFYWRLHEARKQLKQRLAGYLER